LYNQTESILGQYEMEIRQVSKGRGSYICDTDKGKKILMSFRGSPERGDALKGYLEQLLAYGFDVEQIVTNKEGSSVSVDEASGERFLLKDYWGGGELNPSKEDDIKKGASLLAEYHTAALGFSDEWITQKLSERGQPMLEVKHRHYRELIKIRNHIRGRKKKNEFERKFLECSTPLIEVAEKSLKILELQDTENMDVCFCHGDYNQHNIVQSDGRWKIINYENVYWGSPMEDLANFMRKVLEKNQWNIHLAENILKMYDAKRHIEKKELQLLYALLLFPERFWKITNHYMNSHKAWVSGRDIEKLEKVVIQEPDRIKFLENLFPFSEE